MPSKNKNSDNPQLAIASPGQVSIPLKWEEYVSEVPTGIKAVSYAKSIQYTAKSLSRILKQQPIIGMFWLNVPVIEGAIYVPRYYKWLQTTAETYQREHQDSYFEQYPQLLILDDDEEQPTTSELRRNYRKYCKRAAHKFYHYIVASSYYTASLINLLTLSRLDGNEPFKSIAYDNRWSVINSNSTMYKGFPKPTGMEQLLSTSAKYALGKSSDLSDIVCFPLYAVDLFGNRGCHSIPFDNLISQNAKDEEQHVLFDSSTTISETRDTIVELFNNMHEFYVEYGTRDADKPGRKLPRMPYLENGCIVSDIPNDLSGSERPRSIHTQELRINDAGHEQNHDNLSDTNWENWFFWDQYMLQNFQEFYDPRSDWVIIAKDMGIIEDSLKPQDLLHIIRNNQAYKMPDLLKEMQYKRGNHVTTATIVRYIPLLSADDNRSFVEKNFERYNIDDFNNIGEYLVSTKSWPRITPTQFAAIKAESDMDDGVLPFVINSAPSIGSDRADVVCAPVGKFAALLDQVCSANIAPENSYIQTIGIVTDDAKEWIERGDALCFQEAPDNIFSTVVPLLDNTDIYQCGFNIMLSYDAGYKTAWDEYFLDLNNSSEDDDVDYEEEVETVPKRSSGKSTPPQPYFGANTDGTKYFIAYAKNINYLRKMKHIFIFIGSAIGEAPEFITTNVESGNPIYSARLNTDNVSKFALINNVDSINKQLDTSSTNTWVSLLLQTFLLSYASNEIKWTNGSFDPADSVDQISTLHDFKFSDFNVVQNIFSPAYGLVRPAVMPFSLANRIAWDPQYVGSGATPISDFPDAIKQVISSGLLGTYKKDSKEVYYSPIEKNIRIDYANSVMTPSQYYLWFISNFGFSKSDTDEYGSIVVSKDSVISPEFSGKTKYPIHLMVRSRAMFMGAEDTIPFWSDVLNAKIREVIPTMNDVQTTAMVTETGVVSTKDNSFAKGKGDSTTIYPRNNDRVVTESQSIIKRQKFSNKRSKYRSSNKPRSNDRNYGKAKQEKAEGRMSEVDFSNPTAEKQAYIGKRKPVDSVELMQ